MNKDQGREIVILTSVIKEFQRHCNLQLPNCEDNNTLGLQNNARFNNSVSTTFLVHVSYKFSTNLRVADTIKLCPHSFLFAYIMHTILL